MNAKGDAKAIVLIHAEPIVQVLADRLVQADVVMFAVATVQFNVQKVAPDSARRVACILVVVVVDMDVKADAPQDARADVKTDVKARVKELVV